MSPPGCYRVGPGSPREAGYLRCGAAVEREVLVPAVCALPAPDLVSPVEDVSSDRSRPEGGQPGLQPQFQCVGPGLLSQPPRLH